MTKNFFVWGIALLALTACAGGEKAMMHSTAAATSSTGPNIVNVSATEYKFDMPDTLPAGPTLFRFTDNGAQPHHMTLVKLEQGKTMSDLTSLPPDKPFPTWAVFIGGPNTPMPHGGQDEDVVDLEPGSYAVLCVIPGPDGKPHFMHGMVKALTVTASSQERTMPATDLTLTLTNYAFAFSAPPTAGHHAVRVVNKGSQPHESVLVHLAPGKTGEDFSKWVLAGMQGPPPGALVAGTSPMAPGHENTLLLNLKPGDYSLLCFMPDAKDGRPHAMHGMIHDFKIS